MGAFDESVDAGAFKFGDVVLNRMHVREDLIARTDGGGLTLTDSASTLTLRADIPKYREDIRDQVNRRILRGFSVEMRVTAEDWPSPDRRIVKAAELLGIGLVDRAAYGQATAQLAKRAADGGPRRGAMVAARRVSALRAWATKHLVVADGPKAGKRWKPGGRPWAAGA